MLHDLNRAHGSRVGGLVREVAAGMGEQCLSEYSFANLWLFRREHRYRLVDGIWPYISGITYDGVSHAMPLFPLDDAPSEVIDDILIFHDCLYPLSLAQARLLDSSRYQSEARREDADYLYPAEHFRHYRGALLSKKRNLMKQLLREHHVRAEPYGPAWHDAARAVLSCWMQDKGKPEGTADETPCLEALVAAGELGLEGFVYIVDGQPGGFVLAEALQSGVYVMRFAKSLNQYKGLAQYMFHHFCQERSEVQWLNFEQDLGLPNFRQTKRSYQPTALLQKFRVSRGAEAGTVCAFSAQGQP